MSLVSGLEIVDSHCHPFLPALESPDFDACWTLSTAAMPAEDLRSTVVFQQMAARLTRFLGLPETTTWADVVEERSARYRADPNAYVGALFADAGIATLLIDIGYPSIEDEGVEIRPSDFRAMLPDQDVRIIVRIEPVMHELLARELPFAEFLTEFRTALVRETSGLGAVALKTTIAYYTGLDIRRVPETSAARAYATLLKARATAEDRSAPIDVLDLDAAKLYRDFLLLEAMDVAIDRDLPMQFHTGMGNAPCILLRAADPANLQWLLADSHFGEAKVVLVHAGYPNHAAAGFLASTHPNVWVDVSEMVPFIGAGIAPRLRELLDMAPLRKVMYGSDGFNIPEVFWLAGSLFRDALTHVLEELVAAGHISPAFALDAAADILAGNARRLYGL